MADNTKEIQKLYIEYLGRPADPEGLTFWVNALNSNPNIIQQLQHDFSTSVEYRSNYGNMSNRDAVLAVYDNMFGRVGDAEGVQFWTDALDKGWMTIDNMVTEMVKAAEGARNNDTVAFGGRLAVATEFTKHIDTQAEIDAYMTPQAFAIASDFIGTIKDLGTAATAIDPGVIDMKIAEIVGSAQGLDASHFIA
jgi:hypothetical protein